MNTDALRIAHEIKKVITIRWEGDAPEPRPEHPEQHPMCVEIIESENGVNRSLYLRPGATSRCR